MRRLIVAMIALIEERRHLEMARVQSLLCERLRRHDDHGTFDAVHGCAVYDAIAPDLLDETIAIPFEVKMFGSEMNRTSPAPTGIRRPVAQFLDRIPWVFDDRDSLYVLRVTQDVMILNPKGLMSELTQLSISSEQNFMAGAIEECNDIDPYMDELGLPQSERYRYVQGRVMFAPWTVWHRQYSRIPPQVTHLCEDSVVSQLVLADGGMLPELDASNWEHRHAWTADQYRDVYKHTIRAMTAPTGC